MELELKKQSQRYLTNVDAPIYKKLYRTLDSLSRLKSDVIPLKGYANRHRYKIPHYRIIFEWAKDEIVITVIEISTRTSIKY